MLRKLIISCDDLGSDWGSIAACKKCLAAGLLTSGSVIINSEERLLWEVKEELGNLSLGLHLNVFEGKYDNDKQGLFGENGLFRRILLATEERGKRRRLSMVQKMALRDESKRQVESFHSFFGRLPSHLTYHYGIHFVNDFYKEYWHVAEGYQLPFRFAPQYTKLKPGYRRHPDLLLDGLNNHLIGEEEVMKSVLAITAGQTAEMCLHLNTNEEYKKKQTEVFSKESLKQKLDGAGISLVNWSSW